MIISISIVIIIIVIIIIVIVIITHKKSLLRHSFIFESHHDNHPLTLTLFPNCLQTAKMWCPILRHKQEIVAYEMDNIEQAYRAAGRGWQAQVIGIIMNHRSILTSTINRNYPRCYPHYIYTFLKISGHSFALALDGITGQFFSLLLQFWPGFGRNRLVHWQC